MEGVMEATVGMPTKVVAITILSLRPASNQCTHCMFDLRIRRDKSALLFQRIKNRIVYVLFVS